MPGAISAVVEHFRQNPAWDLLYGNARNIDEDDRVISDFPTAPYDFARFVTTIAESEMVMTGWHRSRGLAATRRDATGVMRSVSA